MGTHTYAILDISPEAYAEIRRLLAAAGYADQFRDDVIDMHGIAVRAAAAAAAAAALPGIPPAVDS